MTQTLVQLIVRVMRTLARYIMRGRLQAAAVAIVGNWFLFVTPATVGLVTLRRGVQEGFLILLWGVLPALVGVWASDLDSLMAYSTVAVLVVVWLASVSLRVSTSWPATLSALVATATLAGLLLVWLTDDVNGALQGGLSEAAPPEQIMTEAPSPEGPLAAEPAETPRAEGNSASEGVATEPVVADDVAASGFLAFLVSFSALMALLVGRWWQALVYNPGGFQQEIHNLRLPPAVALASFGATAWCLTRGEFYQLWCYVFGLPLLLAGIGLMHCLVKAYRWWPWALFIFYVVLVLVRPVMLLVGLLAFADTFLNLRYRLKLAQ